MIDLTGKRFGRLSVLGRAKNRRNLSMWLCRCDCGTAKVVYGAELARGRSTSCGCFRAELLSKQARTHGLSKSPEYRIWRGMIDRCENHKHIDYHLYGGRGISVCRKWRDSFVSFLNSVGKRPSGKSLDRKDNSGNYTPDNCRWATCKEQGRNTRVTVFLVAFGERKALRDWADDPRCKCVVSTLYQRVRELGWDGERAVKTKPRGIKRATP